MDNPNPQYNPYQAPAAETGAKYQPIQVENTTQARSKIGLAALFSSLTLGVILIAVYMIISSIVMMEAGQGEAIVYAVSLLIPFGAVFAYAYHRMSTILATQPGSIDDVFFKKTVRRGLIVGVIFTLINAVGFLFTLMSTLFLGAEVSGKVIIMLFVSLLMWSIFSYAHLYYQQKTTR